MKPLLILAPALALAAGAPALAAERAGYDFGLPTYLATGSRPDAVATGDFDGDGRDDVVLATSMLSDPENDFRLWLYRNHANGVLSLQSRIVWDPGSHIRNVTLAMHDLDGDGTDEILLGSAAGLTIYVEDGNGGFLQRAFAQPGGCMALSVLDADLDGARDIACLSYDTDGVILFGDGNAGIGRSAGLPTGSLGYEDLTVGDLDSDGDPDLALLAYPGFAVLGNDGNGAFLHVASHSAPDPVWPFATLVAGDFDGDGRDDIAAAVSANQPEAKVSLYRQDTSGRLSTPTHAATLDLPRDLAARDLDGDSDDDLVVVHGFNGLGRYMPEAGTLGKELLTPGLNVRGSADTLALGDVDGDGCPDAVAAYHAGLAVYRGKCLAPGELPDYQLAPPVEMPLPGRSDAVAISDFDANGRDDLLLTGLMFPEGQKTLVYLQGTQAAPVTLARGGREIALADFNRDGATDVAVDSGSPASLLLSNGSGGFTESVLALHPDLVDECSSIGATDVNRDGALDVVCHAWAVGRAMAFLTDGEGNFGERVVLPTMAQVGQDETWVRDMAFGEFTGDGIEDMLLVSTVDSRAALYLFPHDGSGAYGAPQVYTASGALGGDSIAIGDFNNDGHLDAALSTGASSRYASLFLQRPGGGFDAPLDIDAPMGSVVDLGVDLDRNGADDLVSHTSNSVLRYMQAGGLIDTTPQADEVFVSGGLAVGDLDGDGCSDLAAETYTESVYLVRGVCPGGGGGGDNGTPPRDVASDFDADGRSDLVWRNATTGANDVWRGAQYASQYPVDSLGNTAWHVAGVGDFDGDGHDDLLWNNRGDGGNAIWLGANRATPMHVAQVTNRAWFIAATGDFDGDDRDDVLWRNESTGANVIWKAGDNVLQQPMASVSDLRWRIAGIGDFDGDGTDDVLWRNASSGANVVWKAADAGNAQASSLAGRDWQVAGTGDFDGDGKDDVLWRHRHTGANTIWDAADPAATRALAPLPRGWTVAAVGDYDGDGNADVVWREGRTGSNAIWLSASQGTQQAIGDVADSNWQVQPYRGLPRVRMVPSTQKPAPDGRPLRTKPATRAPESDRPPGASGRAQLRR